MAKQTIGIYNIECSCGFSIKRKKNNEDLLTVFCDHVRTHHLQSEFTTVIAQSKDRESAIK